MIMVALVGLFEGSTAFVVASGMHTAGLRLVPRASVRPVCMAPLSAPPSPEDQKNVRKNKEQVKDFIRRRQGSAKPQPAPSNPPMPLTSSIGSLRFRGGMHTAGLRLVPRASVRPVCMAPLSAPPSPEDQKNVRKNKEQVKDFIRRRQGSAKPQPAPSNPPMRPLGGRRWAAEV